MSRVFPSTLLAICLMMVACQSEHWGTDQTVGTVGGAAAGGLVGSQVSHGGGQPAITAIGVLLGGWLGNSIGAALDEDDRRKDRQAEHRAYNAPIGQQVTWNNPDTGVSGTILPVHDGYNANGAYCRDFQQTLMLDHQQRQGSVKACQQADGSWVSAK